MPERAVRVVISGRVQAVGFRAFVIGEAARNAVAGWVRNRRDGTVEAVFIGEPGSVERMLAACREGPAIAAVEDVAVSDYVGPQLTRFTELPTA
jgi:acylphosphatase